MQESTTESNGNDIHLIDISYEMRPRECGLTIISA